MMALVRRNFRKVGYDIWIMPTPFAPMVQSPSGRALNLPPDVEAMDWVRRLERDQAPVDMWSTNVTIAFVSDERIAAMAAESSLRSVVDRLDDADDIRRAIDANPTDEVGAIEARYAQPAHAELFGRTLKYLTTVKSATDRGWPWTEAWMKGEMWIELDKLDAPAGTPTAIESGLHEDGIRGWRDGGT